MAAPIRSDTELRFRPWSASPTGRHQSLWMELALAAKPSAEVSPLTGAVHADVCIIGGGFSGLWTAIRLLEQEPGMRVVLLEADICGSGASGRNSGGVGHLWSKLPTLTRLLGADDGLRLIRQNMQAISDIRETCERYGVECDLEAMESTWTATSRAQMGAWNGVLACARELGVETPYRELDRGELRELFGAGPYYGGVIQSGMLKVQPAKLARELRRVALELGVQIHEHSPARTVEAGARKPVVRTGAGRVDADQIVLAANVWMAHLPQFKDTVMVVSSDVVATDPIREVLVERGLDRRPGGTNSSMMINYGGVTPDGRVYLGRGGGTLAFAAHVTRQFDYSPSQAEEVRRDFRYLYPELFDVPIPHAWAGAVDRSPSGLPRFGKLNDDDRIHYAIGYTGHGVSATSEAGHILASAVLRHEDHWSEVAQLYLRAQRGVFPPEPLRYLAGRMVRKAVASKDQTERAGREPSPLIKKLAGLAPATIADFGRRRSARQAPAG